MPKVKGSYVFSPAMLKIAETNKHPFGNEELIRTSGKDLAWKVSNISKGKYYLRLLVKSGNKSGEEELRIAVPFLFLNGKKLYFSRATPLKFFKGSFYTIIQSAAPIMLQNGDSLRLNKERHGKFGSLALSKNKLDFTPLWLPEIYGSFKDDLYRVSAKFNNDFSFKISNMTGSNSKLNISCRIFDYFGTKLIDKKFQKSLNSTHKYDGVISFPRGSSDRYRAVITISDNKNNHLEKVYTTLANRSSSARPKMWLNRNWQITSLKDDLTLSTRTLQPLSAIPAKATWKTVTLPANWKDFNRNDHIAFFKKTFDTPAYMHGKRFFIHLDRILYEADIYLNSKKVAHRSYSTAGPFDIEVSKFIKPNAKNTLILCVRDKTASLVQSELSKKHLDLTRAGKIRAVSGVQPGVGEVYLYNTPQQIIGDIFVKTSFRKKTLKVELKIPQQGKFSVTNRVLLHGKEIFSLPTVKSTGGKIKVSKFWDKPICWGPVKFPLLQLETTLKDSSGKTLDIKNTRFGFREVWADGMNMLWNGKSVKFGARPFLSTWGWAMTNRNKRDKNRQIIRTAKEFGCKMLRHIYNSSEYAEIADEEGVLIAQGLQSISGHTKQQLESDEFWRNVNKNAKSMVIGLYNHPSIFTWYLSNEYYGESEKRNAERLRPVGEQVLKLDKTRFIEFGCDLDLRGFTKLISVHYPVDMHSFRTSSTYLPEAAYWRYFKQKFHRGMKVPAGMSKRCANVYAESPMTWGNKPIIVNETCWVSFFNPPYGLTRIFSDEVYTSPIALNYAHGLANAWFARGHRDANVSAITLWKWITNDPNHVSMPKLDINILQRYNKFYAGTVVDYDINISHERFVDETLQFTSRLLRDGKVIQKHSENIHFDFCELVRRKVKITMPEVSQTTSYQLVVRLHRNGKIYKESTMAIKVYPRNISKLKTSMRTGIFRCPKLLSLIANAQELKSFKKLKGIQLLILGNKLPENLLKKYAKQLNKFVEDGGKVLILHQNKPLNWLPISLQATRRNASINYSFRPKHPLLKGISSDELKFWYPGHKVASDCWRKPTKGNYRNVIEAGGPNGLEYVSLMEIPHGKGLFICMQMDILSYDKNPVAIKFWGNILSYTHQEKELKPAGFFGLPAGKLINTLKRLGVSVNQIKNVNDLKKYETVIWDPNIKLNKDMLAGLKQFVTSGGNLLVHDVTPENVAKVSTVCGGQINLSPVRAISWQGRAVRRTYSSVVAGLNNQDLFWKKRPETENYWQSYYSAKGIESPLGKWIFESSVATPLLYPALLSEISLGKGKIILDNLLWTNASTKVKNKTMRLASVLLTNLGIKIKKKFKINLDNLTYQPLNISKFLNRTFVDQIDADGKGGWTDQGADCDMRNFKLKKGIHKFNDVPFIINRPKGCLVLYSKYRRHAPEKVSIPVKRKASALFFLQSCAWTSAKHHASYLVNYADGSKSEIKLIGGVNLRDWGGRHSANPFTQENETFTRLAIKVPQEKFGFGSIYQMAWFNPYPKKMIKSIDFVSMKIGVPVLIAITTALPEGKEKKIELSEAQKKIAIKLNKKAEKLIKLGKYTNAKRILKQAQAKAPGYHATCMNQGYVYWELKQYRKSISAFKQALKAKPQELEPYLQIGKCYESLGDYTNAVKTYRKSLAVDINQPDIFVALNAAKKKQEK